MAKQPVKLADIARAAGVSLTTASQVMNDTGRVAESTRERVREAARALDYQPNALARSVASGRSHTIGILAENASGAFCMPVLVGATRALTDADFAISLFDAAHDPERRRQHVRVMQARHVDGVIVIGEGSDFRSNSVTKDFEGPVVYALSRSDTAHDACVLPDDVAAGRLAGEHLLALGRRRIAHVTAEAGLRSVQDREAGLRAALRTSGLDPVDVAHGSFSRDWGYTAARRIVDERTVERVDAIFAGNDQIAIALYAGLTSAGVRVPDDIAIVGVDNIAGQLDEHEVMITSVDLRFDDVGALAVEQVLAGLDGDLAGSSLVEPRLVTGRSTVGGPETPRALLLESLLG